MTEARFAEALLAPDAPLPRGLVDPMGRAAPKRFSVYRNNVAVGLTAALEEGFPVVRKLVGEPFFAAMAGVFLRQHPPRSPLLMFYGGDFAAFLSGFPPVAHLGYLPDVARLEYGLRESYHAADAPAVPAEALAAAVGRDIMGLRLRLAPALRLILSDWPILSIWRANRETGAPPPTMHPETALVLRAGFDPVPHLLRAPDAEFLGALIEGNPVGLAAERAPEADAGAVIGLLLSNNAITEVLA